MRAIRTVGIGTLGAALLLGTLGLDIPSAHAATADTIAICDAFGGEDHENGTCRDTPETQAHELGFVDWTLEDDGSMTFHVSANDYTHWARFGVCIPFSADISSDSAWYRCDPTDPEASGALTDGVTSDTPLASSGDGWYAFPDCLGEFTFEVDAEHVPDSADFRFAISIDEAPEDTDDLPPATPSFGCNRGENNSPVPQYQYEAFGRVQPQAAPAQPTTTTQPGAVADDTVTRPQELPRTGASPLTLTVIAGLAIATGCVAVRGGRARSAQPGSRG